MTTQSIFVDKFSRERDQQSSERDRPTLAERDAVARRPYRQCCEADRKKRKTCPVEWILERKRQGRDRRERDAQHRRREALLGSNSRQERDDGDAEGDVPAD